MLAERTTRRVALVALGFAWTCSLCCAERLITVEPEWGSQLAVLMPGLTLEPRWHTWFTGISHVETAPTLLRYTDAHARPGSPTGCTAIEIDRSWRVRPWVTIDIHHTTSVYEGAVVSTTGETDTWTAQPVQIGAITADRQTPRDPGVVVVPTIQSVPAGLWFPARPEDAIRIERGCPGLLDDLALASIL